MRDSSEDEEKGRRRSGKKIGEGERGGGEYTSSMDSLIASSISTPRSPFTRA